MRVLENTSALGSLLVREWIRFIRQRSRVMATIGTPLLFWIFMASGLATSFPQPVMPGGKGFLEYFFPAGVMLVVLFSSIFSNISIIEDRREGFLQSVLVSPVSGWTVVGSKVLGGMILATVQALCFLLVAPWTGFGVSLTSAFFTLLSVLAVSFAMSAFGFFWAWWLNSVQGFHGIMNLVLFPMWLLCGSFFPIAAVPAWLQPILLVNPLAQGLLALKVALYGQLDSAAWVTHITWVIVFGGLCFFANLVLIARRGDVH